MSARALRTWLELVATLLCLWAALFHTPPGALLRSVVARLSGRVDHSQPLLSYFSGGLDEASVQPLPPQLSPAPPDAPAGLAMGRGAFAALSQVDASVQRVAAEVALARGGALDSPDAVGRLLTALGGAPEAAMLTLFAGETQGRYAQARAQAEGRPATLEVLAQQLPPASQPAVRAAQLALAWGTAFSLAWPVERGTRISSRFGDRSSPVSGQPQFHPGVDLAVPEGTPVHAVAPGVVRRASEDALNGRIVIIDHGFGVATAYCHNSELLVTVGQRVEAGTVLSRSGNTGRSTGAHLHYQLEVSHHPVDPLRFHGS
jgi:murein DD-endopeptidase MepM/ murein hydrolase activator NlpD